MSDPLLRRPFDHYARYRLAADVLEAVGARSALDVGGGPGSLAAFAPAVEVVATDLHAPGVWHEAAPVLALADGARLPFADAAFDAVVTLDTLEHVPAGKRDALIAEACRVAAGWVLVVCPCATAGVADADAALLSVVRRRFGEEFSTVGVLTEHLAYGHPDPAAVVAALEAAGAEVTRFPSGRLDRWLPMMLAFFDLLALGDDAPVEAVQAWYNTHFYRDDLRDPAYRQGFLARVGPGGPPPAGVVADLLPDAAAPPLAQEGFHALQVVLQEELAALVRTTVDRLAAAEAELAVARAGAGAQAARAEAAERRADAAEQQVAALEAFRQQVLAHPALRARRWVRGLLGRD